MAAVPTPSPETPLTPRAQKILRQIKETAARLGYRSEDVATLPESLRDRMTLLLVGEDRRLFVRAVSYRPRGDERIYLDVGDGGGAEVRYNSETKRWEGFYGSVRVQKDVASGLDAFLTVLLES